MRLNQKQFDTQLSRSLSPVYLLSSDVPLLLADARASIISAAKKQGFLDREICHIEQGVSWESLSGLLQNQSLFSQKRIIDLRHPSAKFDKQAQTILSDYLAHMSDDLMLMISTNKLTAAQQKTAWCQSIKKHGVHFPIWPINASELPQWILERAKKSDVKMQPDAARWLSALSEGNLLAAQQAIEKLSLRYPSEEEIAPEKLMHVVTDQSRFNVFDLANAALAGNARKVTRILSGLQQLGVEPTLVLWSLCKECRDLIAMKQQLETGTAMHTVIARIWSSKKTMTQRALSQHSMQDLYRVLSRAAEIDETIKGARVGNVWESLMQLSLLFK